MRNDVKEIARKVNEKFARSARMAAKAGILPYKSENGQWLTSPYDGNSWWTGGFWPALMWQLYAMTGEEAYSAEARRAELHQKIPEVAEIDRRLSLTGLELMQLSTTPAYREKLDEVRARN